MSSHDDLSKLQHLIKDVQREVAAGRNTLNWVLLLAAAGLVISIISMAAALFK